MLNCYLLNQIDCTEIIIIIKQKSNELSNSNYIVYIGIKVWSIF